MNGESFADARAEARIAALERRLAIVEAALMRAGYAPPGPTQSTPSAAISPSPPASQRPPATPALASLRPPEGAATPAYLRPRDQAAPPYRAAAAASTPPNALWAWITRGNTPARVGVVLLFIGVGFLLKYLAEHVSVPAALRLAGVAFGGVVLLVLGWILRERRRTYATILQGAGTGVLYLTVFAALELYALVPAPAAFGLFVAIAVFSAVLAVKQDSPALAAIGVFGGFAAPILTSASAGNHVVLFSYYAVLNAGILGIAWFRSWRALNLLGFACTFIVGTAWGVTRYHSGAFATTEPFLVLFFLFYVAIAVLYAVKRSVQVRHYVDGTIVFGTPLLAAGLQHALVWPFEYGMAISALAVSALYLVLARVLWTRERDDLRLLTESFLALGVVFATLAIPLAFDARWTSATWALEAAAIVWMGVRQSRLPVRIFGVALQIAASVPFWWGGAFQPRHAPEHALPLLNSDFLGLLLVAAGGLVSALAYHRGAAAVREVERRLTSVALAWGVLWWVLAGANEIDHFVAAAYQLPARIAFATATALAFAVASRPLAWPLARAPALLLGPVLLLFALPRLAAAASGAAPQLFAHGGVLAWPVALVVLLALLRRFELDGAYPLDGWVLRYSHAVWLWVVTIIAAHELAWLAGRFALAGAAWRDAPWGIVPALVLAATCVLADRGTWPVETHRRAYHVTGALPLLAWMLLWSLGVGVGSDADPAPLPYVPLLNPVDLTLGLIAAALVGWARALVRDGVDLRALAPSGAVIGFPAALAFLWVNAIALRCVHYWFGVAWSVEAMWHSTLVQAMLSLLWTLIALATMVGANRRAARAGWLAGAALLAVVVAKLFVVDLSRIGSVERIVSFIGVGLLLLLIGYVAPVPSRLSSET